MQVFGIRDDDPKKEQENNLNIPSELPILALRGTVVYPLTVLPLNITVERDKQLVNEVATAPNRMIGIVSDKNTDAETPGPNDVAMTGSAAVIHRLLRAPDDSVRLIVQGVERIRIEEFVATEPYLRGRVQPAPETFEKTIQVEALMRNTVDLLRRLSAVTSGFPEELIMAAFRQAPA